MSWSFALQRLLDEPLLAAIASASRAQINQFAPQGLSNTAWALASLAVFHEPLLDAIAMQAMGLNLKHQERSNTVWAFATLKFSHEPFMHAIAATSIRSIANCAPRHLANTAWAFAVLEFRHQPLMAAISATAMRKLNEMSPLSLASTAWAGAKLKFLDQPLMTALASTAISRSEVHSFDDGVAGMALWALAQLEDLTSAQTLAERLPVEASSLTLGALLSAYERRNFLEGELAMWRLLARGELRIVALNAGMLRLIEAGRTEEADGEVQRLLHDGTADLVSTAFHFVHSASRADLSRMILPQLPTAFDAHEKELRLLAYVLSHAPAGDPNAICGAVEVFGQEVLAPTGQWLKVAGGEKVQVLFDSLSAAAGEGGRCCKVLEIGTYCGYSAIRMATMRSAIRIISLEADPAHVAIARCLVAFAGLSHVISVRTGHSQDVLPALVAEERRLATIDREGFDLVFFDQCGARFASDLGVLEDSQLLRAGSVVVADNVLKPGAPVFLWQMTYGGDYKTHVVSVREFAMPDTEDWMSVSIFRGKSNQHEPLMALPIPTEIYRLERDAERTRARAQCSGSGAGVGFDEWARLAAQMRRSLVLMGIGPHRQS